jgi:predicted GTPase
MAFVLLRTGTIRQWQLESTAAFPRNLSLPLPTTTMIDHYDLPVISRANTGKTTLLQRVCTENSCISDDNNKDLVSVHRPEDEFSF